MNGVAQIALTPTVSWSSNLSPERPRTGAMDRYDWTSIATTAAVVGTGLGAYHGYKRNSSVGWAIVWGLLGGAFPIIAIPVAFAQGFAKRGK